VRSINKNTLLKTNKTEQIKVIDFPKPNKNLWQLIGPSVLFVALSISGGEMLIWPDLIGKYGVGIAFLLPLFLVLQASVNLEIERYSLATGKPAITGLGQMIPQLRLVVLLAIFLSLVWPAWISTAGNMLALLLGRRDLGSLLSILLLAFLLLLWQVQHSYKILENFAKAGLLLVLAIGTGIVIYFSKDLANIDLRPNLNIQPADRFLFISALAYGGVSGILNFVQSDWIINKGYGKGNNHHEEVNWSSTTSKHNWRSWWQLVVKEHLLLYLGGNFVGTILLSLVAYFTLTATQTSGKLSGFGILAHQVNVFNQLTGFAGYLWGIGVILIFVMAQMTILDAAGKLIKNTISHNKAINKPLNASFLSLSAAKYSQIVGLAGIIILAISAFIPSFRQPEILLQISAVLSAILMVFYPSLLLILNYKSLPAIARPKWNILLVLLCSFFYLSFIIYSLLIR
jgi:hypothetical protein